MRQGERRNAKDRAACLLSRCGHVCSRLRSDPFQKPVIIRRTFSVSSRQSGSCRHTAYAAFRSAGNQRFYGNVRRDRQDKRLSCMLHVSVKECVRYEIPAYGGMRYVCGRARSCRNGILLFAAERSLVRTRLCCALSLLHSSAFLFSGLCGAAAAAKCRAAIKKHAGRAIRVLSCFFKSREMFPSGNA